MPQPLMTIREVVELTGNVPPSDPVEIRTPKEGELEVRDAQGDVFMRVNNTSDERRPVRRGETVCWGEGRISKILLDNGEGDGGSVDYEIRIGYTVRGFGGSEGRTSRPGPSRLAGQLRPGTTIADGGEACEEIDARGIVDRLRFRARVSGTTQLSVADVYTGTDPGGVAVDEERGLVFVHDGGDGLAPVELRVYEVVDGDTLNLLGTVNPTTLNANAYTACAIDYDSVNEKVVGLISEPTANEDWFILYDVQDPTTPAVDAELQVGTQGATGPGQVAIDAAESLALIPFYSTATGAGAVSLVEYTTPGAPTEPDFVGGITPRAIVLNPDTNRAWVALNNNDYALLGYTSLGLSVLDTAPYGQRISHFAVDRELGLVFVVDDQAEEVIALDYNEDVQLAEVWREQVKPLDADGVICDPSRQLVYTYDPASFELDVYAYNELGVQANVGTASGVNGFETGGAVYRTLGVVYLSNDGDNQVEAIHTEGGRDLLRVRPLRADGTASDVGAPPEVVLPDGVEKSIEIDPVYGEGRYEVCVLGRSGVQTEVDFVEWSGR